jgi:hypothetical protein
MKVWKFAWLVAPNEPGVVEIGYTGNAGADTTAMDDALRAFESESCELHKKIPRIPSIALSMDKAPRATKSPTRRVFLLVWPADSRSI